MKISGTRPTLSIGEVLDERKVTEFCMWFLINDSLAQIGRSCSIIFEAGQKPHVPFGYDPSEEGKFDTLTDWFVAKMNQDIRQLSSASAPDFKAFVDKLNSAHWPALHAACLIAERYGLNFRRFVYERQIQKIPAGEERHAFKESLLNDAVIGAETRILGWLYHVWFGDWYEPSEI